MQFTRSLYLEPQDIMAYVCRAESLVHCLDINAAAANLRKVSQLTSLQEQQGGRVDEDLEQHNAEYRKQLAAIYDAMGVALVKRHLRTPAAAEGRLVKSEPDDVNDITEAVSFFGEAINIQSMRPKYWIHRALAFIRLQRWGEALRDVDHCLLLDESNPDIFVLRAKLHWKVNRPELGNADFKSAHKLSPTHPEVIMFEKILWDEAETVYRAAADFFMRSNFGAAETLLSTALELNPGDVKLLVMRASAHRQLGDFPGALSDLAEASGVYATAQRQKREKEERERRERRERRKARRMLQGRAAGDASSDEESDEEEGGRGGRDGHGGDGGGDGADGGWAPEHPEITRQRAMTFNDMAVAHYAAGRLGEALTLFNKAVESERRLAAAQGLRVTDARLFLNRGDCYRARGKLQHALADYHVAYDFDNEDYEARTRLALLHNMFGP